MHDKRSSTGGEALRNGARRLAVRFAERCAGERLAPREAAEAARVDLARDALRGLVRGPRTPPKRQAPPQLARAKRPATRKPRTTAAALRADPELKRLADLKRFVAGE